MSSLLHNNTTCLELLQSLIQVYVVSAADTARHSDPAMSAIVVKNDGIPLIIGCLSSPVQKTVSRSAFVRKV